MHISLNLKSECAGNNFRITEKTNPRIYKLYQTALRRLDISDDIPLYSTLDYDYNAYATGARDNFIVVHSSCINDFSDGEMLQLLGHELGHIKSGHVLYHGLANTLNSILASFGGIAQNVSTGIQYALMEFNRNAEYTADRAGLIAAGELDAAASQTMKLLGHSDKIDDIVPRLKEAMVDEPIWYIDLKNYDYHYIIFNDKIFKVDRDYPEQYEETKKYGMQRGILEEYYQMLLGQSKR